MQVNNTEDELRANKQYYQSWYTGKVGRHNGYMAAA